LRQQLPRQDRTKSNNDQGLYKKFQVTRTDGTSNPGQKHYQCEYFVIDIDHDPYARAALRAYALACRNTHPQLYLDMVNRYGLDEPV